MTNEHDKHRAMFRTRPLRDKIKQAEGELVRAHMAFTARRNVATMSAREAAQRRLDHYRRQLADMSAELETEQG